MEALRIEAPAKVNLFLRVLAREESGFHQLESLFMALEFGDTITLERAGAGIRLETEGIPCGPAEDNLVFKATRRFLAEGGVEGGVRVHLRKTVPPGAGLGGGSSDAASTLMGLQKLFPGSVDDTAVRRLAAALGSDVPFFLSPTSLALAWGRGDRLLPLPPLPRRPVVLALPPLHVPTPDAYLALARERESGQATHPAVIHSLDALATWEGVGDLATNDFEAVIFRSFPLLASIRRAMGETNPAISLLSGSGAALFAVYENETQASAARDQLASTFPETSFVISATR